MFKMLKGGKSPAKLILYPARLLCATEGEIEVVRPKLEEFMTTKQTLQKVLKDLL